MITRIILAALLLLGLSACAQFSERPLKTEYNTRPEIGVRLRVMPSTGLPKDVLGEQEQVLLVVRVSPERPAAQAGIQLGDVLVALDGQTISGMGDSVALMQNLQWGDEVIFTVLRDEELQEIPVLLRP